MKIKNIICDLCGETVDNRRETGYKLKSKHFWIDNTYHNMDICQDCMNKIRNYIEANRELKNDSD